MNLTKKQQLVLDAINRCPESANDDALLLEQVWMLEGWSQSRNLYDNLCRVTRPETISRRRRELFNMGLIKYSETALDERTTAFKNELDNHSDYKEAFNQMFGTDDLFESFPKIRKG
jgi:hypothetical protein